jgi:hypothetical protein
MASHLSQRCRGQKDAGSWAAGALVRLGEAALIAVFALTGLAPAAAWAASHAPTADPAPQPAPVASSPSPTPDPAPQTAPRSTQSHTSAPATSSTQAPSVVSTSTGRPHVSTVIGSSAVPARPSTTSLAPSHVPRQTHRLSPPGVRHLAAPRPDSALVGGLKFPLALPRDLLLLPRDAIRAGSRTQPSGVLLLLSSVAMAVVAVASFVLLRRLRRVVA